MISWRATLPATIVLATGLLLSPILAAASAPDDACKLVTQGDLNRLGIVSGPTSRAADSPNQAMRICTAGTGAGPPMFMLMIQDIKLPIAVQMGRKRLEEDGDERISGPWDIATISWGADGMQVHFFKGNRSVMVKFWKTDDAARAALIDIASRVAGQ